MKIGPDLLFYSHAWKDIKHQWKYI